MACRCPWSAPVHFNTSIRVTIEHGHANDLRGAEVLRAEHLAAEGRGIVDADVLGADPERESGRRDVLAA